MLSRSCPIVVRPQVGWTFASSARRLGAEERSELRAAVDAALRAGHGAGARWTVEVAGGRNVSLSVFAHDRLSERWVENALLAAYPAGAWHRHVEPDVARPIARWTARRQGLPGEPAPPPADLGRLAAALVAALRNGGPKARLTVELRPAAPPRYRWLDLFESPTSPPRSSPTGRASGAAPPGRSAQVAPVPSLVWSAAVDLWCSGDGQGSLAGIPLGGIRSAWTALDGRPLLVRPARIDGVPRFRSLLALGEIAGLLPPAGEPGDDGRPAAGPAGSLPIGRSRSGGVVGLPVEANDGRHFALLGETGMGKSSLLVTIGVRAAALGGILMLDPIGETASALRDELEGLGREVLWVSPGARGCGANALAGISAALPTDPVRAERELQGLVQALRRVRGGRYADAAYWGPRIEEMLGRAVRAAASVPGGTLEDAYALLGGAGPGRRVVPAEAATEVRELLARVRDRPEDADGALRLLYEIVRNPTLVRLLCARKPDIALSELVAPGQRVIVSGSASRVGEATARYLLATYLALGWSELLARPAPAKTFVLLDEAQWFGHEALGEMLRLARRCNVHVGLATQSLGSLAEGVQEAVRTNVADLVAFRGSADDGRTGLRRGALLSPEALAGLGRGEAIALLGQGTARLRVRTACLPNRLSPPRSLREEPAGPAERGPVPAGVDERTPGPRVPEVPVPAATDGGSSGLVAVDVARLRAAAGEAEVRALGSELGRRGAIVRTERREAGPIWWVLPEALGDRPVPPPERSAAATSRPAQRL